MTGQGFKALLVAAGIGSRLRPVTDVLPKCLVPICGEPLLGIWLDLLFRGGATEVVINLHHHADLVRDYLRRTPYRDKVTTVFEDTLLGTAGTLVRNRGRLGGGPVFFAHADNLSVFDLHSMFDCHRNRPADAAITMMTFQAEDPRQCGVVELDSQGIVVGFHEKVEKPPGNLANAAVFVLEPEVIEFAASLDRPFAEFSVDVLPHYVGRMATFPNDIYHRDIGSLEKLLLAQIEYPLVRASRMAGSTHDPWFGLMREADGRLARQLMQAVAGALAALRKG